MRRDHTALLVVLVGACLFSAACQDLFPKRSVGEKIFRDRCAECHGIDGQGNTPRYMGTAGADLIRAPNTGGDPGSMEAIIREGVFAKMPANPDLTYTEMKDLIRWIRVLRGETAP